MRALIWLMAAPHCLFAFPKHYLYERKKKPECYSVMDEAFFVITLIGRRGRHNM